GRCRVAAGGVSNIVERERTNRVRHLTALDAREPMTIRGGGNPYTAMAAMPLGEWTRRLGALPAEAYDCFMVGTLHGSTEYKRGSRAIARGQWQAPLGSSRGKPPDHGQFAAVLALVKDKPSAALKKRRP